MSGLTGGQVVRGREVLGLTRAELARRAGLPYSRIASIELSRPGWTGWREGEQDAIATALRGALNGSESRSGSTGHGSMPAVLDTARERDEEWCGLKHGQAVRIDGFVPERARFRFDCHVKTPTDEYVQLWSERNGGGHCVRPERVLIKVRGGWRLAIEIACVQA